MSTTTIILIIVIAVIAVLLVGAMLLLVIVFGHPDDKSAAYFPKAVTLFGLWLAFASLLVLPYDVAASASGGSSIQLNVLWQVVYITLAVLISVLVPFAFFYYESEVDDAVAGDPEMGFFDTQTGGAVKYTLGFAGVLTALTVILYSKINAALIPVIRIAQQASYLNFRGVCNPSSASYSPTNSVCYALVYDITTPWVQCKGTAGGTQASAPTPYCMNNYSNTCPSGQCVLGSFIWNIPVSFPLYVICVVAFIGWFAFVIFGGVGFIALPLDLINDYRYRPVPLSTKQYFDERSNLGTRAKVLVSKGEVLRKNMDTAGVAWMSKSDRSNKNQFTEFEKEYYFLKKDYQLLYVSHQLKGGNPVFYFLKLIFGVLGAGLSAAWLIHIILFILPAKPINPFLNSLFQTLSTAIPGFPLFGVIFFAIFSFYLLLCVVAGNFKLGVRFLFFTMYPMEYGNTLMNAFLFNTWIILFASIPACQFCVYAFPYYTTGTTAQIMFGNQIQYLEFFSYFFANNVFILALIAVSGLTAAYMSLCPENKAAKVESILEKLAKSSGTSVDALDLQIKGYQG